MTPNGGSFPTPSSYFWTVFPTPNIYFDIGDCCNTEITAVFDINRIYSSHLAPNFPLSLSLWIQIFHSDTQARYQFWNTELRGTITSGD